MHKITKDQAGLIAHTGVMVGHGRHRYVFRHHDFPAVVVKVPRADWWKVAQETEIKNANKIRGTLPENFSIPEVYSLGDYNVMEYITGEEGPDCYLGNCECGGEFSLPGSYVRCIKKIFYSIGLVDYAPTNVRVDRTTKVVHIIDLGELG